MRNLQVNIDIYRNIDDDGIVDDTHHNHVHRHLGDWDTNHADTVNDYTDICYGDQHHQNNDNRHWHQRNQNSDDGNNYNPRVQRGARP